MRLDLSLVPDIVKPLAQPLTGGAVPEADVPGILAEATTLEHLADLLAGLRADDAGAVARMLRGWEWQGPAKEAFEQAFTALGGQPGATGPDAGPALLDLLEQALRDEAAALREHGVRMQHTEWMIYASLALLGAVIVRLLVWIYVNGPAVLKLIQHNTLLTRMRIQTIKRLVLSGMLTFGGISGGLDLGVQVAQQIWGDREAGDFDVASLALSTGSGALTGALFAGANAGLSRLLSRNMVYLASEAELAVRDRIVAYGQSMYGQALLGGLAGTGGAVPGLALSGQLDTSHLAFALIAGVSGGLDVPPAARVSYTPMQAVAQLGDPPVTGTSATVNASAGSSVTGYGSAGSSATGTSGTGDAGAGAPVADSPTPVHQPRPERHGDVGALINRRTSEPGGTLAPPHQGETIVGEVTRRHDTPLSSAEQGGVPVRPAQSHPAEQTPAGPPRSEVARPGELPRDSLLPANIPTINAPPEATAERHHDDDHEPADTAPAHQRPADAPVPLADAPVHQRPVDLPVHQRPVDLPAHQRSVDGDLGHQRPPGSGEERPAMSSEPAPGGRSGPGGDSPGPVVRQPRDHNTPPDAGTRASKLTWTPHEGTVPVLDPVDPVGARQATGDVPTVADPRPRNFAEAAAMVHRWTPDSGDARRPARDGWSPDSGDARRPVPDAELLAEGRRLRRELGVVNDSETTAWALARMSRISGEPAAGRAVHRLAAELGLHRDIDALVDLYNDAERFAMAPDGAAGRAALVDSLRATMAADSFRWTGYRHRHLFGLRDVTAAQARAVGLMVGMMGERLTQSGARDLVRPLLDGHVGPGAGRVAEVLPVVRAAQENGCFPAGTSGAAAFRRGMERFWHEDPYLWNGVLLAERHAMTDPGEATARLLAHLDEIAAPPGPGRERAGPPLERLAEDVGLGRSVGHLVRLAEEAQAYGAGLTRAADVRELVGLLAAHRARDPYRWDGLRIAAEHGFPRPRDDEARSLARLAELTRSEAPSRLWMFDPLRRLATEAGLGQSVERLARRAADVQQAGFDLFGPVDRRQVIDALTPHAGRAPEGPPPEPRNVPPGLHDLSPSAVQEARQAAAREHARAQKAYRSAHSPLRRSLSLLAGPDPLAVAEQERVASLDSRVQAWRRWPERPEVSFTRDVGAFRRAYDRAMERAVAGEAVIPYMSENATASLADRDGGRGFGLELEFDLPDRTDVRRLEAIARSLREAGLTGDAQVHSRHTMHGEGYRSGRNGGRGLWSLERDGTVAGELVSPILYDEPATWENLRVACEIIRSHGGTASPSTGGHVHVSTHDYDHIVENYAAVLRYADHHADTLFRLAQNPERAGHRGLAYCRPNDLPAAGYQQIDPVRHANTGQELALNMEAMRGTAKDHIELRLWDGSLDPAVIQSQVKVSLALVEAAFRTATLGHPPNGDRRDHLGAHAALLAQDPALDVTERGSRSFRMLMDELFWRAADKEQLTALFAATRWVPGS
ncbi:amidoligase family protein [Nonomuraea sp. B1E8]|uniref:amidoligase family protein n=1 Tax=unclassified Nonomuraea TaxID=2593643 RepID=UPI00325C5481